jgi:hypothetical protein
MVPMRNHDPEWLLMEGELRAMRTRADAPPSTPGEVLRGLGLIFVCALAVVFCINVGLLVAGVRPPQIESVSRGEREIVVTSTPISEPHTAQTP